MTENRYVLCENEFYFLIIIIVFTASFFPYSSSFCFYGIFSFFLFFGFGVRQLYGVKFLCVTEP